MIKLTPKQEMIYNLIKDSETPINAEELHLSLMNHQINLSTVYRALDKLYNEGIISRSYLENKAYYTSNLHDHHHFMTCNNCNEKIHVDCHIDEMVKSIKKLYGFTVLQHDLNFYGLCKKCQN